MTYTKEQRIYIYDCFVKYNSWSKCARKFRKKYPDDKVPDKTSMYRLVRKVRNTGSVSDRRTPKKRYVLTEDMLDNIGALLESNPDMSLRHVAQHFGISLASAGRAKCLLRESIDILHQKMLQSRTGMRNK
ncbi:hypothetical protein ANN_03882 [Periplaneta americana]|uniref:DUF4817 domain-containing protein n=1 Tax=Periplaneta americana TaxID=6978 RepID=A0ABQ8U050_PERAM|nr:hypothetical protein ANN_03882 [Periplaneta americana]